MDAIAMLKQFLFPTAGARLAKALSGFDKAITQLEKAGEECSAEALSHQTAINNLRVLQDAADRDCKKAMLVSAKLKQLVS